MILIDRPIICEYCGLPIISYSLNNTTGKLDFRCSCGKITSITEAEYVKKRNIKDAES